MVLPHQIGSFIQERLPVHKRIGYADHCHDIDHKGPETNLVTSTYHSSADMIWVKSFASNSGPAKQLCVKKYRDIVNSRNTIVTTTHA